MASESNPRQTLKRDRVQGDSEDRVDPSTSRRGTPSSTRLANKPKEVIEKASKCLRKVIFPTDGDVEIVESLPSVWAHVQDAIEKDPELKI